jgi:hypothetical protein
MWVACGSAALAGAAPAQSETQTRMNGTSVLRIGGTLVNRDMNKKTSYRLVNVSRMLPGPVPAPVGAGPPRSRVGPPSPPRPGISSAETRTYSRALVQD